MLLLFLLFTSRLFKFCFVCVNLQVVEVLLLFFCLPPGCLSFVLFVLTSRLLKCCCCLFVYLHVFKLCFVCVNLQVVEVLLLFFLFTSRLFKFCCVCVNLQVVEVLLLFCLPPGCLSFVLFVLTSRLLKCCCCFLLISRLFKFFLC